MIELLNISFSYGRKKILRNLNVTVRAGECVVLAGANGSGKSTALSVMAGVLRPSAGSVQVKGSAGFAPQGTALFEDMSVLDNLRFFAGLKKCAVPEKLPFGVEQYLKTRVSKLSGGMKKQVSIACALLGEPQILLLDEKGNAAREGEICIRGTRLTLGYYRDKDRTAECFVQNPLNTLWEEKIYRTGDIGTYNDRGELVFLSRKDQQIKHMGHRIELGEIELAASANAFVQSACCTYDSETKRIVLNYVGSIAPADLTAYLREKLPRYMMPASLRRFSNLPVTPNGKLDRKRLKEEMEWKSF